MIIHNTNNLQLNDFKYFYQILMTFERFIWLIDEVLPLLVSVYVGVVTMKGYSTLRKSSEPGIGCCLFGFYGISTFVVYLMPNPFLYK